MKKNAATLITFFGLLDVLITLLFFLITSKNDYLGHIGIGMGMLTIAGLQVVVSIVLMCFNKTVLAGQMLMIVSLLFLVIGFAVCNSH